METIDATGKPCPIPVIEAKKVLAKQETDSVLVKVDNIVAVQNLEKMARGYGYEFSYFEKEKGVCEVSIYKNGKPAPTVSAPAPSDAPKTVGMAANSGALVVVISRDTMGEGAEELGKILIKGFIYSLTELPKPPEYVIFLNSGAFLTTEGANTIDDLKKLVQKGTEVLTCGTCASFYGIKDSLAVGAITDMYGITEKIAFAAKVVNI